MCNQNVCTPTEAAAAATTTTIQIIIRIIIIICCFEANMFVMKINIFNQNMCNTTTITMQ